ncbi:MAG: hypothetical protein GXP30_00195 [Verrucomicrobia bacterium]|nr:hypothetical protein [Verrucomicrobiota bacterium]
MGSEGNGESGNSYGVRFDYTNTPFLFVLELEQVDETFRPAMGFVQRDGGVISNFTRYRIFPNSSWLQQADFGFGVKLNTSPGGEIESERLDVPSIDFVTAAGDTFYISPELGREVLFEEFEINEGVVIPIGDYATRRLNFGFQTSTARLLGLEMNFSTGEFFTGNRSSRM